RVVRRDEAAGARGRRPRLAGEAVRPCAPPRSGPESPALIAMAIDLNRFIATFFDEAHEHLEAIEERAMVLNAGGKQDPEVLNAIFRAAHSIKGGSGTFGFTQLTEATHEMETLFDALRKGKGKADDSTVRLLLDACDVFKSHLARLKEGEKSNDPAMDALRAQFIGYRAGNASGPATKSAVTPAK